jgi:hypothetical protein
MANSRLLAGLLLVESTPQLTTRIARPFDFDIVISEAALRLPVSLEYWTAGRPFAVFECFRSLLCPHDRLYRDLEDENLGRRELTLFSDEHSFDDAKAFTRVVHSMWTVGLHQWQLNLEYLTNTFRQRRIDALELPGMRTYLPLIHLRQLIVGMREHLRLAHTDCVVLDERVTRAPDRPCLRGLICVSSMDEKIAQVAQEIEKLDTELNAEIHLIIGAVTVQDSDTNKEQTERATLLTLLAAVYLPLTLVTGIFGMNIREIDQSKTSWRVPGEALAVVAACTIVFVVAYRLWRDWRRRRREKEHEEFGFDKDV